MAELTGERKVYSEFFTNLGVAWFSGGVITPLVAKPKTLADLLFIISMGILGTIFSLKAASLFAKEEK